MGIHADDRQNMKRMIGELTPALVAEAELRTQLWNRAGNTGQLGVAACIDMVRFCGLGKVDVVRNAPMETYDFRNMQVNTDIWVRQEETGLFRRATFVGPHPGGRVAVRYVGFKDTYGVKPCNCLRHEPPLEQVEGAATIVVDSPVEPHSEPQGKKGKKPEPAGV
jgi:hypothetical protein